MRSIAATICLGMLFAACGSTDPYQAVDPATRDQMLADQKRREESDKRINNYDRVLIDFDKAIDKLGQAYNGSGNSNADELRFTLNKLLREKSKEHFDELIKSSLDAKIPRNQAIALSALGFSERAEALDPLLNGLLSEHEEVVNNATFGLAILKNSNTPPRALQSVFTNKRHKAETKTTAAWALYQIQTNTSKPEAIIQIWNETLSHPIDTYEPGILISALRGFGLARNPEYAPIAEPYVSHTTPKVREACCITLGRLGNRKSHTALLTLLSHGEPVQNVRLAARIALRGLAGQEDRGFDAEAWKKVFQDQ